MGSKVWRSPVTAPRWWDELQGAQCTSLLPPFFLLWDKKTCRGKFLGAGRRGEGVPAVLLELLMRLWSILRLWPCGAKQPLTQGRDQLQNKSLAGKHHVSPSSERGWQHPDLLPGPITSWVLAFPHQEFSFLILPIPSLKAKMPQVAKPGYFIGSAAPAAVRM